MMWDIVRSYKRSNKVLHRAVYPRGMQATLIQIILRKDVEFSFTVRRVLTSRWDL